MDGWVEVGLQLSVSATKRCALNPSRKGLAAKTIPSATIPPPIPRFSFRLRNQYLRNNIMHRVRVQEMGCTVGLKRLQYLVAGPMTRLVPSLALLKKAFKRRMPSCAALCHQDLKPENFLLATKDEAWKRNRLE